MHGHELEVQIEHCKNLHTKYVRHNICDRIRLLGTPRNHTKSIFSGWQLLHGGNKAVME